MATAEQITDALEVLHEEYPSRELTDGLIALWIDMLGDLPGDAVEAAIRSWIQEGSDFFPRVGKIRQKAFDLIEEPGLDPVEAFYLARDEASRVGANGKPTLEPVTAEAIRLIGGWQSFCLTEEAIQWQRKRFVEAYDRVEARRQEERREIPQLKAFRETKQLPTRSEAKKLLGGDGNE